MLEKLARRRRQQRRPLVEVRGRSEGRTPVGALFGIGAQRVVRGQHQALLAGALSLKSKGTRFSARTAVRTSSCPARTNVAAEGRARVVASRQRTPGIPVVAKYLTGGIRQRRLSARRERSTRLKQRA